MSPICNSSSITYKRDYQQEMQHVPVWFGLMKRIMKHGGMLVADENRLGEGGWMVVGGWGG